MTRGRMIDNFIARAKNQMNESKIQSAMESHCPPNHYVAVEMEYDYWLERRMPTGTVAMVRLLRRDWGFMWGWLTMILDWLLPQYLPIFSIRVNEMLIYGENQLPSESKAVLDTLRRLYAWSPSRSSRKDRQIWGRENVMICKGESR